MPTLKIEEETFNKGMKKLEKVISQHKIIQTKGTDLMNTMVEKLGVVESNLHNLSTKTQPLIAIHTNIDLTNERIDEVN